MGNILALMKKQSPKRIALWAGVCVLCLAMSLLVLQYAGGIIQDIYTVSPQAQGDAVLTLKSGDTVSQEFIARGRIGGLWIGLIPDASDFEGNLRVTLTETGSGTVLFEGMAQAGELPLPDVFLASGRHYCLSFTNETGALVEMGYNPTIQSGKLFLNGQQLTGFLNFAATRISAYEPTPLFYIILLLVNLLVIVSAWLVLFTQVKVHVLYLILAMGFGFAMLFDLTPLYGFDMRYHFDSTYVMSNQLLGIEGQVVTPSLEDPEKETVSYYRRYGDDYSQFCHYHFDFVSANYTDTYRGLRSFLASPREQELILTQTYQDYVEEQLFLYLPQAAGFALARLLGLSFYPMLQLGRAAVLAVYILLTYLGIKAMPFGKRMMMILALMPTSLIHAASINRDAMIIAMCFYLIPKVLSVAYSPKSPTAKDWISIMAVSVILAPCKMAYVPVSFLWLLIIYRKYILEQKWSWKKAIGRCMMLALPILAFFLLANITTLAGVARAEKPSLDGTPAYTVFGILTQPGLLLHLLVNTLRTYLGSYLTNAVQLFDIGLGSGDGMTLVIFFLLLVEVFSEESGKQQIRLEEKGYGMLVLLGVFFLLLLASVSWTPNSSSVIQGLQGRYLTPVLPLLGFAFFGSSLVKTGKHGDLLVCLSCCVFPALVLLNMYIWSISGIQIDLALIARFC